MVWLSYLQTRPAHQCYHRPPRLQDPRARRNPLLPPVTASCWARTGEDCRPRTTWRPLSLAGSPVFSPALVRLLEVLSHADLTVPRQDVSSPSLSACATLPQGCSHTRSFGTLAGPPPPVKGPPCGPHPPGDRDAISGNPHCFQFCPTQILSAQHVH